MNYFFSSIVKYELYPYIHNSTYCMKPCLDADEVFSRAKMYQEFMNQIPIPTLRGSLIPFDTWMGLARSLKQLYDQPLHYLTNVLVKQWDQLRVGTEDESRSLDSIIHPVKAEASIWLIEEVHRKTTSPHHIAKLWVSDPMHHAFVDSIIPTNMKDALQCL